jgi:hypothetical protein
MAAMTSRGMRWMGQAAHMEEIRRRSMRSAKNAANIGEIKHPCLIFV